MSDAALDALLLPLNQRLLAAAPDTLFLRAREGASLHARLQRDSLHCVQPFKPWANALERAGFDVAAEESAGRIFGQTWLLPPRQREEARALIARAFDACAPGGVVLVSVPNDEGAKSIEGDFRKLVGGLDGGLSKFHCRVFWARRDDARLDGGLWAQWRNADAPRPILDGRFISRPGVFAWNRVDAGSALLAEQLPDNLRGAAADLGAGWGFLSDALLSRNPGITSLDAFEADARALDLARQNLAPHAGRCDIAYHWHDVTTGLPAGHKFDVIISNPPFHDTGKVAQPEIGKRFLHVAADALAPSGSMWLVANAHLPYESLLAERFNDVHVVTAARGYKVFEARGAKR
ncbi:MAG: class I SAM-dependent methyltransferase [Xanthomonadaceae bacterium]|nr:class I SAM-dependent methyltransferase [Xanthomonadaceae bacterium]